ncbi:MAG: nucleoside-diphosphate sugar epimerase/dehydratase [Oscillospiraceae bacterium]|nr:nucleoside-diphosphate sugar epimerase/dehydratase [Oscillospiraceae bacterium]
MFHMTYRKVCLLIADFVMLMVCAILSYYMTMLIGLKETSPGQLAIVGAVSAIVSMLTLWICGAYAKQWRHSTRKDYLRCVYGIVSGTIIAGGITLATDHAMHIVYWAFFVAFSSAVLIAFRFLFRRTFLPEAEAAVASEDSNAKRVMIIGAGNAGTMLLTDIENARTDPEHPAYSYLPVCMIDDNMSLVGNTIRGVKVMGSTKEIPVICQREKIDLIVLAIPSSDETDRKRILDICSETKLPIKVLPFISQLVLGDTPEERVLLSQVRDIDVEGLLGREPITFDKEDIRALIQGKVCMVTGGGGSIGSELVRQIAEYHPAQVVIVDIYENNAYDIQTELSMRYGEKLNLVTLIASVRDYHRMSQIFDRYRPDIVFHAAAHKHVPLMEHAPMEAIKNNVIGTLNVATLADFFHVKKFVMISTDKAVNPTNVMGASKRCCEMIVQYMAQSKTDTEFVTTRFGNVLGSNGSVIPLFKRQIESGGPVTVTHPDIIRYFMTIPEAVSLVLQAGAMAHGGEIFVLDMGEPVKIVSLAENLIRMYGKVPYKDIEIHFTGLRPGEKLFEELLMNEEGLTSTSNKKIFIGQQISIDPILFMEKLNTLRDAANANQAQETVELLADLVPTFHHKAMELHDEPVHSATCDAPSPVTV